MAATGSSSRRSSRSRAARAIATGRSSPEALEACRRYGAKLIICRLDRLSRDPVFLLSLRDAGIDFIAVDMPNANRMTVGVMALVAEQEREAISQRTKAALAAAKARGVKLGNPRPETARFPRSRGCGCGRSEGGAAARRRPTSLRSWSGLCSRGSRGAERQRDGAGAQPARRADRARWRVDGDVGHQRPRATGGRIAVKRPWYWDVWPAIVRHRDDDR